jgi:starch synthase
MLAAENGGLPGGKVGGMGDVIRELPAALARRGHRVSVLTPAYGFLARLPGIRRKGTLAVPFAGATESCRLLEAPSGIANVDYGLLDHARFAPRGDEHIYHDDDDSAPFATDAGKFAFFSAAGAEFVRSLAAPPDVVHLHDWHTGLYLLIRGFDAAYRELRRIRTVFTIHNLALQGIRPVAQTDSSLRRWFPALRVPPAVVDDPRYPGCVNPMAVAIRLADAVSTVSPGYAAEILVAGDDASGRHGGEGLEELLAARHREGDLTGILNGCEYPAARSAKLGYKRLLATIHAELMRWIAAGRFVDTAAWLADKRLAALPTKRPPMIATSVGRITEQKTDLFCERLDRESTAIDAVLRALDDGVLFMLGNGDPDYEDFLQQAMARHANFVFLKGYSDRLANALYSTGDLFLMPSSFEPCGISQMLAMRAGQPCVVHAVGGLKDTVTRSSGFPFDGATPSEQARNFVREVAAATGLKRTQPQTWRALAAAAARERFTWDVSAGRYLDEVYAFDAKARR